MEQLIGAFRNEKISSGVLGLLLLVIWYTYGWANEEFVKHEDFHDLKVLIVEYIDDSKIVNAGQLLRDHELALSLAVATNAPEAETEHLKHEIAKAREYKQCLINKRPNCKHIKPNE